MLYYSTNKCHFEIENMIFSDKIINYSDTLIDPGWIPLNFPGDSWDFIF